MVILPEDVLKVLLSVLIGGLVGAEREFRDKAAGFRTMIFICVGAALFSIFSAKLGSDRIAANIATGVGFIGAGVIMREAGRVTGLTTAAMIWLTAALGMGVGYGHYLLCGAATGIALVVLWLFPRLEDQIKRVRDERTYEVVCPLSHEKHAQLQATIQESGLHVKGHKQAKAGSDMICTWETYGSPSEHDRLVQVLLADPGVKEFHF